MRLCDVMLSFPPSLVACSSPVLAAPCFPTPDSVAFGVLILSITPHRLGPVRPHRAQRAPPWSSATKEYVQAARVTGVAPLRIMARHVLPNVMGPVMVLATIQVATAIITEATLSFLGVGVPPTSPSLGTLIRVGNDYLFSGEWWITVFPGLMLIIIAPVGEPAGRLAARRPQSAPALKDFAIRLLGSQEPHRRVSQPPRHLRALDDISFAIAPAKFLGVVGESGAGKEPDRRGHHRPAGAARARCQRADPAGRPAHRQPAHEQMRHIRGRKIGPSSRTR